MGRVITVVSGKGGAGKTTVSCCISECLAKRGRSIAAVDGDMGLRNLDIVFGVADEVVYDISDVLEGRCALDKALIHVKSGPYYLAAADKKLSAKGSDSLKFLVAALKRHFDYVVIDCPAGAGDLTLALALFADLVIVVTEPTESAVRDAERIAQRIREKGGSNLRLIINKLDKKQIEKDKAPDVDKIIDTVAVKLLGIIPFEQRITDLQNSGKRLLESRLKNVIRQVEDVCGRLEGRQVPLKKL